MTDLFSDIREESLLRPDVRRMCWTRTGSDDGIPMLRMRGTPGSRWYIRADRSLWSECGLQTIVTERLGRPVEFS